MTEDPVTWPPFLVSFFPPESRSRSCGLPKQPVPGTDLDDASVPMRLRMIHHIKSLQTTICSALEAFEPTARFESSYYLRDASKGFGDSRVLQDGETFEKAGCSISVIKSTLSAASVHQMRAERFDWWDGVSELPYFVAGAAFASTDLTSGISDFVVFQDAPA